MKKRIVTLLVVLVVLIGAMAVFGQAAATDTLTGNVDSKTISADTELNLAGFSIGTLTVEEGVTVTLTGVGTTGMITEINGGGTVVLADGEMLFAGGHKLTLGTAGITLRTGNLQTNGASVYYTSTFGGDATVKGKIVAFGLALGVGKAPNFADKTYTRNEDMSKWNTSKATFNDNGVLLKGIMKTGNAFTVNKSNASKQIFNVAYVELTDGTRITSNPKNTSLQTVVERMSAMGPNGFWNNLAETDRNGLINFYETFENVVKPWETDGLDMVKEETATTYVIYTKHDLSMLAMNPTLDYKLNGDLDGEGITINGAVGFTGSIDGNGKTLSNVTINGVGLVDTIASGKTVKNLHLRGVSVVVPSSSVAQYVGIIAATNNGTVTGVTIEGSLRDTRTGSADKQIYAGVFVGKNNGTVTPGNTVSVSNARDENGNLKMSITDSNGYVAVNESDLTVTGLAADAGLWMNETSDNVVRGGLVGAGNAVTNAASVIWSDRSYSTERQAAELQRRREVVEVDVFLQGTIKWTPATTIKYWNDQTNNPNMTKPNNWWQQISGGKWHIHNQTLSKGTTYYGIPYTHCATPLEQAMYYLTEGSNGVYTLSSEVTTIKGGKNNAAGEATWTGGGGIGWGSYFGSDCSGGLTTSWHKVSPILTSGKNNNGVCLFYTSNMVPSQYNQWYYGFMQVGDYEVDDATWSGGTKGDPVVKSTTKDKDGNEVITYWTNAEGENWYNYTMDCDDIMAKIGAEGFYEAYAQSQLGDIVVAYSRTGKVGHARLIAADPVVIRNGNNEIDETKSYFLFHEQGAGLYTSPGISSWRINWKCSFAEAAMQLSGQTMGGNGVGYYLPITMKAFHNTNIAATGGIAKGGNVINGNNPIKYALNSSYRIMSATMIIKDADGNVIYEATRFQGTSSNQARRRAVPGSIPLFASDLFADCDDNLVKGNVYYVTFSGTTYGGVTDEMMKDYMIVYDPAA